MMRTDSDAGSSMTVSLTITASDWYYPSACRDSYDIRPIATPAMDQGKRPKYDPHNARQMWQPRALAVTSKPSKRPSRQVEFNQVSKLRPVRPRYLSRKR